MTRAIIGAIIGARSARAGSACGVRRRPRPRQDAGEVTIWVVVTVMMAFSLTALVVDGSVKRQARVQSYWAASEAARAAVAAVGPRPDSPPAARAVQAATAYLAAAGVTGSVQVLSPREVRVTTHVARTGPMLGITWTASSSVTADLLIGVETGQAP